MAKHPWRKRIAIACFLAVTILILVLQGDQLKAHAPANNGRIDSADSAASTANQSHTSSDVEWVYMSWPIPSEYISKPLIGTRDQDRIDELLGWLSEAKAIDGKGLTSPMMGRSMAVNIEYRDSSLLTIRPAWHCDSKKEANGNTETSCTPVNSMIWVSDPVKGEYFAESEKLFQFVSKDYSEWLPNVLPYEVPAELKPGSAFTVLGHGARTDKVNVSLSKGDRIIWEQSIAVDDGEWQGKGEIPADLPEGDYDWKIDTGNTGYGKGVHID
jgi:hypothetical protein